MYIEYAGVHMKRFSYTTVLLTTLISSTLSAASPQVISGPGLVGLDPTGNDEGVSFINQNVNETTLVVPDNGTVNKKKNTDGISTDANGLGNIDFHGLGGSSKVYGSVGKAAQYMDNIYVGGGEVIFYNGVHANSLIYNVGGGSTEFKGNAFFEPAGIVFNVAGTLLLDKNASFTGNIFGAGVSSIELFDNSTVNGNIQTADIKFRTTGTDEVEGATVNGNISTSIIDVSSGGLIVNGDLELNGSLNVIQLVENNAIAVPIPVSGSVTVDGAVSIEYHIPKFHAPRTFAYNVVNAGTGGTSGASVNIVSRDVRFSYIGSNENGNITVTAKRNSEAEAGPVKSTGKLFDALLPIAYEFPNSDLDLIEGQLGFPTYEEYNDALYQIAPNIAAAGLGRETFNTSKRFLKNFLEHLTPLRSSCYKNCGCGDIKVWIDGIGSYAHQKNKSGYLGYSVNNWETSFGLERSLTQKINAGLGFGYGYTKLALNKYDSVNHMNTYLGLAYLRYQSTAWFFDCGATYGYNHYDTCRHINFNTINRKSTAKFHGSEATGFAVAGYDFCRRGINITPFCSIVYSHIHVNSYKEQGADILSLKYKTQNYNYVQSGLGLKGSYSINTCMGCLVPEIHTIWLHDFYVRPFHVTASFSGLAALGGYITDRGIKIDQDTWNIGGSLSLLKSKGCTFSFVYDYEKSSTYYNHQGMLNFSYNF